VPNSGYGESAEQDNHAAEDIDPWLEASLEDDDGLAGSHSGECGCIAGPKYPDLDACDV